MMTPPEFISKLRPHAEKVQASTGVPWQALVSQAALETGWLKHPTVDEVTKKDSYNLFNIKWSGRGNYVTITTTEYVKGKPVKVKAQFRAYKDYGESFEDYANLVAHSSRYSAAVSIARTTKSPVKYVEVLQSCGYATDPQYAAKLTAIMRKYMGVTC